MPARRRGRLQGSGGGFASTDQVIAINALPTAGAKLAAVCRSDIGAHSAATHASTPKALDCAFALLFNQIALAQHLCLYTASGQPLAAVVVDAGCHSAPAKKAVLTQADTDAIACAVHCDDSDKQPRDVLSLKVPDLIATGSELAQLRSTGSRADAVATAELPGPAQSRRTTDFGVLLI